MSLRDPEMAFVETVEASARAFEAARQRAKPEAIAATMDDFTAAARAQGGGFVPSQTVKERRAFEERQAHDALQAAARQYQQDHAAGLETIAFAERQSETLPDEVDTLGSMTSNDARYAAMTAQALVEANLRASLTGATLAEVASLYASAVERKDRMTLRFLERSQATGWRGVPIEKGATDTIDIMRLSEAMKAQRASRHPAWCKTARERLAQKATTASLLQLVTDGRTAIG